MSLSRSIGRFLCAFLLGVSAFPVVSGGTAGEPVYHGQRLSLGEAVEVYPVWATETSLNPAYFATQQTFRLGLADIEHRQPSYWLLVRGLVNATANGHVVLVVHGSIVDRLVVTAFADGRKVMTDTTGYRYPRRAFSYAVDLSLESGRRYDLLVRVDSRYLTGPLKVELRDPKTFQKQDEAQRAWVYLCVGALLILGLYNLFLFVGVRDASYLFYALYLFAGIIGWAAIFNILANYFGVYELGWNLIPFYLAPVFNSLFLLSFLRVRRQSHPVIFYWVCVLMSLNIVLVVGFIWVTDYLSYYSFILYNSTLWILLSLWAGVQRYLEGYKPARFFILGFVVLALGGLVSILPGLGIQVPVDNFYLVTLTAQTLDMTLLALALADKIALMRVEKQAALKLAHQKDLRMLQLEKRSNKVLAQANDNMQQALNLYEEQERKRKNFLLLVNHELRTPVNAIMESAEHVDEPELKHGVESLSLLLDQLSVFSELSNDDVKPVPSRVNLSRFAEKLEAVARRLCAHKPIALEVQVVGDCDLLVDGFLLEAAIKPVLDNACRFTESGVITLTLAYQAASQNELPNSHSSDESFQKTGMAQGRLVVTVVDTGCGIAPERQERVLSAFEQGSEGYSRQSGGLGLGLYIARTAMGILGGSVELSTPVHDRAAAGYVAGECAQGLQVTLSMECEALKSAPVLHGFVQRALVVEDNAINAKVLDAILTSLGVEVVLAQHGQQAVAHMLLADGDGLDSGHGRPDVIFMDLQMPVMDGFEATRQLRTQGVTTPIVAVTANSEQSARHLCFELGMSAVLVKPVRAEDIRSLIESLGGKFVKT